MSIKRRTLTPGQREIWIGQQLDLSSALYNMAMACEIRGKLNEEAFGRAWDLLQEDLRRLGSRVELHNAEPVLIVEPKNITLEILDFSDTPLTDCDLQVWLDEAAGKPLRLSESLTHCTLIKNNDLHWIFFCNQHHLITDAGSFSIMWDQLLRLYEHIVNGDDRPTALSVSPSYRADDMAHLDTEPLAHSRSPKLPPLPRLYGQTEALSGTRSKRHENICGIAQMQALSKLAKSPAVFSISRQMSQYQLLMTCLFAFLYRVSTQSTLAIGSPIANRSDYHARRQLGLLMEIVPVSMDVSAEDTFSSLLRKVRKAVMQGFTHANPDHFEPAISRGLCAILNYIPASSTQSNDLRIDTRWVHSGHADRHHLIRLHVTDWNDTSVCRLDMDINEHQFSISRQAQILENWRTILNAMLSNMDCLISKIHLDQLAENETDHSIDITNKDFSGKNSSDDLSERFSQVARQYANEPAVTLGKTSITYAQLKRQSSALAEKLQGLSIGTGDRVAVYLQPDLHLPVCLLGILESGAAYVPIDHDTPLARVQDVLHDSQASAIITNTELLQAESNLPTIRVESLRDQMNISVRESSQRAVTHSVRKADECDSSRAAYCLYTSGSTGRPKAVVVSHAALTNYCNWAINYYSRNKRLSFPFFTPLGFDLTVTSLFVPLLSGGQIVVYPPQTEQPNNLLQQVLSDNKVDIIKLTPAHLALLQPLEKGASRVKQLIVGGDDLKCSVAQRVYSLFSEQITIHNEYGPTEATVGCVVHQFDAKANVSGSVPIGHPVAGMRYHILNEYGGQQASGVPGELYLSGPSLADGYWNRPELTKAQFKTNFIKQNTISYRTGDLVRQRENGELEYLGRLDNQVKIRGARVELAEIENAILAHPFVSQSIATVAQLSSPIKSEREIFCKRCGLSSNFPETTFNDADICSLCVGFEQFSHQADNYFKPMPELMELAASIRQSRSGKYDCMMLLSGGKDSTYALARLCDLKLSVLAFTLDNGYLSNEAMANITRVCAALGVDHEFGKTQSMPDIFVDSLKRFSNVCNGCFKTIYTLSMQRAQVLGIPYIFTGLSRGQFFETRLTEALFTNPDTDLTQIDSMVLSARKAYHRADDAVSRLLNTEHFRSDEIFEQVQIVDFYRYCSVDLESMLSYLQKKLPWVRPKDTGRSTNCLINDVGIYVHKKVRGFHNYSLPYSWDVRLGHKKRDEALDELSDEIDEKQVYNILTEIGYPTGELEQADDARLALYYISSESLSRTEVQNWLAQRLPKWSMPSWIIPIDDFPLNSNGKIDRDQLPKPGTVVETHSGKAEAPTSFVQKALVQIWCKYLRYDSVGIHDNFFELGGDSLTAIRIATEMNQQGIRFQTSDLFEAQTIEALAHRIETRQAAQERNRDTQGSAKSDPAEQPAAFSQLSASQKDKLSKLIKRK